MQMPPVRFAGENGLCLFPSLQLSDAAHPDPAGDVLYPRLLSAYAVRGLRLWESERLDLAREPDRSGLAALFLEGCECFDVGSIAARLTRFSQDSYRSAASFNGRPTASRSMAVTAMYAMSSVSGSPYPT